MMAGKDFTTDGEAADIGTVFAIGHGQFQETAPAKLLHKRPAGFVRVRRLRVMDGLGTPLLQRSRQLAMARLEERPGENAAVGHRFTRECSRMFTLTRAIPSKRFVAIGEVAAETSIYGV